MERRGKDLSVKTKSSYRDLEQQIKHLEEKASIGRRAEEALRQSEDSYRYLIENANDIIYKIDIKGYFSFFNPVAVQSTGRTGEELYQEHYLELIRPDYREKTNAFYISQYMEKIPNTYFEFPLIKKNGEEIWLGQNVRLQKEGDRITGFLAVARDITKQKRAEEALKESQRELERRVFKNF